MFPAGLKLATLGVWGTHDNRYTGETYVLQQDFYQLKPIIAMDTRTIV